MRHSKITCLSVYQLGQVICNLCPCTPKRFWSIAMARNSRSSTVIVFRQRAATRPAGDF